MIHSLAHLPLPMWNLPAPDPEDNVARRFQGLLLCLNSMLDQNIVVRAILDQVADPKIEILYLLLVVSRISRNRHVEHAFLKRRIQKDDAILDA